MEVLNRDDRLLLRNSSGRDVVVLGYEQEPYARIDAGGDVWVNANSNAYYINAERDGKVPVPGRRSTRRASRAGSGSTAPVASSGTTIACTGWARTTRRW